MKLNLNKVIYFLIIVQILSVQGIITFNFFKIFGYWELKSLVHPISAILLFITIALIRIQKGTLKITSIDLLFFMYFFLCFLVLLFNTGLDLFKVYMSFREVFLIFLLIFLYQQIEIAQYYLDKILRVLFFLVIANLGFILLTHILGPRDYMTLLTGRYNWPVDYDYKFKISSFTYFWRSPGLIGSPGNVGYFGLLSYLLFDQNEKYKKKKVFAVILAIAGFVRSVYVVLIVYWALKFFLTKKNLRIIRYAFPYILPLVFVVGYFLYTKGILDLTSLFMRIDHWVHDIPVDYNVFIGGGIGEVGAAVRGAGFVSTLDSYWLLMLISVGLVGVLLLLLFLYVKSKNNNLLIYALIGFLIAGFFITLTQGIAFIVLFPLLFIKVEKGLIENKTYE